MRKLRVLDGTEEEKLHNSGRIDEAYEHFLLYQSGELAREIRVLFDPENLPSRIFPRPRLMKDLLALLNDESVADIWEEDETIGWVYQYFIEEDKARVFDKIYAQKKKMDLRDIPPATQIFTPKWIVRYLVENTLGRLWLRMHPDSTLRRKMAYYVPNDNDAQRAPLKPVKDITLLDPACGTMHFGMVAFDLFYEMYLEELERAVQEGWPKTPSIREKADIPASIIENNLYGIDLDLRAIQLSALSLFIKAKSKNGGTTLNRLNLTYTDIPEFPEIALETFADSLDTAHAVTKKLLRQILPILNKAYYLGSLLKIETVVQDFIEKERIALGDLRPKQAKLPGLEGMEQMVLSLPMQRKIVWEEVKAEILNAFKSFVQTHKEAEGAFLANESMKGLNLIDALIRKHDVVVCNPPYSGRRNMNEVLRNDLKNLYPKKDGDLYTAFIDRCLDLTSENHGFCGMVTIHSFMFTSSHEEIRREIINNTEIETMAHLGTRTEFDVANKTAQGFTMYALMKISKSMPQKLSGVYFRLVKENEEEKHAAFSRALEDYRAKGNVVTDPHVFILEQEKLKAIPGWPVVYWVNNRIIDLFRKFNPAHKMLKSCRGLSTGDNDRFLRLWWELGTKNINFHCSSTKETESSLIKWYPFVKGGEFNKWYGNQDATVNWENDGKEIRNIMKNGRLASRPQGRIFYFKKGCVYTYLTASNFSLRLMAPGFIFSGDASNAIFPGTISTEKILGLYNSAFVGFLLKLLNPTISTTVADIYNIPIPEISVKPERAAGIEARVKRCIQLKRQKVQRDGTSWEFISPPVWSSGLQDLLALEKDLAILETDISQVVYELYEIDQADINQIEAEFCTLPGKLPPIDDLNGPCLKVIEKLYREKHVPDEVIRKPEQIVEEEEGDEAEAEEESPRGRGRQKRFLNFEELCLASGFHPETVYAYITANNLERQEERYELAVQWVSYAIGIILGRFKPGEKGALGSGINEDGQVLLNADFAKLRELVDEDGIMVLDPGHPDDLPVRVEEALRILLGEKDSKEVIQVIGGHLRRFLEREFYTKWHIPQYRKRPVYWLLQTSKKSYGLYLFHERLTADSLYLIQERYLQTRITLEQNRLSELKNRRSSATEGKEKRSFEKEIDKAGDFIDDLLDFQKKVWTALERGYDPDIDDGVILNMAPLHELIPWAEPKKYWEEIEKDRYDWAHLAMKYWPERVKEKCRNDKSLAIAHGLER